MNDITDTLKQYATSAGAYGVAVNSGDSVESDKHFDVVESSFAELKQHGRKGLELLAKLMDSDNEGIKLWSAAHLLNYPEFESLKVLQDLKNSPSLLALTAEVTLDQWQQGKLHY